jgi:hypothetical protein
VVRILPLSSVLQIRVGDAKAAPSVVILGPGAVSGERISFLVISALDFRKAILAEAAKPPGVARNIDHLYLLIGAVIQNQDFR